MSADPIVIVAVFGVIALAFAGWAIWRQLASERRRWTRYNRPRGSGPRSWVCPTCLTRHYGERAIRERRCRNCEEAAAAEG